MINRSKEYLCSVLKSAVPERVKFDATLPAHRAAVHFFNTNNRWENRVCPFEVVWPQLSIPNMCNRLMLDYYMTHDAELIRVNSIPTSV